MGYLIVWSPLQLTHVPKTPDKAVFVPPPQAIALPIAEHAFGVIILERCEISLHMGEQA